MYVLVFIVGMITDATLLILISALLVASAEERGGPTKQKANSAWRTGYLAGRKL